LNCIVDGLEGHLEKSYRMQTIYTKFNMLKAAYNYCSSMGIIEPSQNIFSAFGKDFLPHSIKRQIQNARNEEYESVKVNHDIFEEFIFDFIPRGQETIRNICALAYYTGMRLNEVCSLTWENVLADQIYIPRPKERHPRTIPLKNDALLTLQSICPTDSPFVFPNESDNAKQFISGTVTREIHRYWAKFRKINPRANFRFSFKSLRTAFVQNSQYDGHSIEGVRKAVGHRTPYITDYAYNGSLCDRAIAEFNRNPKNSIIASISAILRRDLPVDLVRAIDVNLFKEKVIRAAWESRKVIQFSQLANA
jgi:integrase